MNGASRFTKTGYAKRFTLSNEWIRVTGLSLWFAAVTFPFLTLESPHSFQFIEEENLWHYPMVAIFLVGIFLGLSRLHGTKVVIPSFLTDSASILLFSFGFLTIIINLLTARWNAMAYGGLYLLALWAWNDFWRMSAAAQRSFARRTFIVLVIYLIGAVAIHGWPQYRWIGGIHPNHYGAAALSLLIVARLCGTAVYRLGCALAFSAIIMVSSRYALLSCIAFSFAIYVLPLIRTRDGVFRILLFNFCLGLIVVATISFDPLWNILDRLFALSNVDRGLGTNLVGRIDLWNYFSFQFFQEPIIGYGFRQRQEYLGTHNAYLNLVLESGLIASLFLGGMALTGGRMLKASLTSDRRWRQDCPDGSRKEYVSDYGFAVFLALAVSGVFQPQFINFGDPFGVLVFMMLGMNSYPVGQHDVHALEARPRRGHFERSHLDSEPS